LVTEQMFANAYQRGYGQTVRFLCSRGVGQEAAVDAAQGAWTKAWERRTQLRNPAFLLTWVNSIALNVYRTMLRRERPMEALEDREGTKSDLLGQAIDAERILSRCNANDRIVLEAHYIRGFRLDEIARANHWSETAARIRLLRARRRVRQSLLQKRSKVRCLRPAGGTNAVIAGTLTGIGAAAAAA
jgi:RNA polymerase sigma-70 factor (ECF subfamily)